MKIEELFHAQQDESVTSSMYKTLENPESYDAFSYDYNVLPDFALTTIDNPFNPYTQWDEWYNWDEAKGYHTCSYLARVSHDSEAISDQDSKIAAALAIDTILNLDPFGFYKLVVKPSQKDVE